MSTSHISIKQCDISDLQQIIEIGRLTFAETFEKDNTPEDMQKYLDESFNSTVIQKELTNPNSYFYLAYYDGHLAGYMKLNTDSAQTEKDYPNSLEVQRIYIAKQFKRKHIGAVLIEKAIEIARDKHVEYVWLGVWEFNDAAIAFYKKYGFEAFSTHVFQLGTDPQTDIIMKLTL